MGNIFVTMIGNASTKLLTLVAGAEQSIHTLEHSNPLVGQAIALMEQEGESFPGVAQAEAIAKAVLGFAQAMSALTQSAGAQVQAKKDAAQG